MVSLWRREGDEGEAGLPWGGGPSAFGAAGWFRAEAPASVSGRGEGQKQQRGCHLWNGPASPRGARRRRAAARRVGSVVAGDNKHKHWEVGCRQICLSVHDMTRGLWHGTACTPRAWHCNCVPMFAAGHAPAASRMLPHPCCPGRGLFICSRTPVTATTHHVRGPPLLHVWLTHARAPTRSQFTLPHYATGTVDRVAPPPSSPSHAPPAEWRRRGQALGDPVQAHDGPHQPRHAVGAGAQRPLGAHGNGATDCTDGGVGDCLGAGWPARWPAGWLLGSLGAWLGASACLGARRHALRGGLGACRRALPGRPGGVKAGRE